MKTKGLKLIGRGLFSKVYRYNDKEVLIESEDYVKECMALFVNCKRIPRIERLDRNIYKMKYYPKVRSLKESLIPAEYELYKELRGLGSVHSQNEYDYYILWRRKFETVKNKSLRNDLMHMIEELVNYGTDISFEISPRNVAVDKGKLILLDCFFIRSQCRKVRENKTRL